MDNSTFEDSRDELRVKARENIAKVQEENRRGFNKKRKKAAVYRERDLIAIRRAQRPGTKFASKYLGPYSVTKVLRNDRYIVSKVGEHEGPLQTSTAADSMKPWVEGVYDDDEYGSDEDHDEKDCDMQSDGPVGDN